ncbi:hypothetical protein BDV93DRAFT_561114 [Ceratobasidium sp. AG-I]|nr:hypothetical protein BDV93DRAFT_561114 [Ceratobasidium sp. AG-I]
MPHSHNKLQRIANVAKAQATKAANQRASAAPRRPITVARNTGVHLDRSSAELASDDCTQSGCNTKEKVVIQPPLNRLPLPLEAEAVLASVNIILNAPEHSGPGYAAKKLKRLTIWRYMAIQLCLNYFLKWTMNFTSASVQAAKGQGRTASYAQSIRGWIRTYINTGDLPADHYGWWNVSTLEDEDVSASIRLHCSHVGKYVTAAHVVKFLGNPVVRKRLGLKKAITIRTAERWLRRAGYLWRKEPKGQYFDGHEREDVVTYRQTKHIPAWQDIESRIAKYTKDGLEIDPDQVLVLKAGERPVIVWFHDESTFYAHDRRLVPWVYIGEHPTPSPKGEGNSVMIADFVSMDEGWLRGKEGFFVQLSSAIELAQREFPDHEHVFVYDNAPSHMKRPVGAVSAVGMTKFPRKELTFNVLNSNGAEVQIQMENGRFRNGAPQPFYFPGDHPKYPG